MKFRDYEGKEINAVNAATAAYCLGNGYEVIGDEKDELMEKNGLYSKYVVRKADTGEAVTDCFVLRPGKDPAAVEALREYARVTDNRELATDILRRIAPLRFTPEEEWYAKGLVSFCDGSPVVIGRDEDGALWWCWGGDCFSLPIHKFPAIRPGETVAISDIIGGEHE